MKIAITSFKIWLLLVLIVTMVALSSQQEPNAQKRIKRRVKRCKGEHNYAGKTKKIGSTWTEIEEASGVSAECRCIEYKELLWFPCEVPGCRDAVKKCDWQGCETEEGGQYEPWVPFPYKVHKPTEWIITYPARCVCDCVKPSEAIHTTYTADAPAESYIWDCDCGEKYYYEYELEENKPKENEPEELENEV